MINKSNDDQLVLLKRAFAYEKAKDSVDVDKAWKEFETKLADTDSKQGDEAWDISEKAYHPTGQSSWMKIAAFFVGLLMLSGISYAAYHIVNRAEKNETALVTDSVKTPQKQKAKVAVDDAWLKIEPTQKAPVIFEDIELSGILEYIADKMQVKVEYRNQAAAHIRFYLQWDSKDSLQDIIDKINHFDKVHLSFDEANQMLIVE